MNQTNEARPAPVAGTPPQAGEARDQWWWVERCVWTERMLTRLTASEPADRVWFRLWDKTYAPANLQSAFQKVWRNGGSAGADEQTVAHFGRHAEAELQRLHAQLRDGTYQPQPVRRAWIAKPGSKEKRPLGIPAVRDRIVQGALRHVLEPIFEAEFASPREIAAADCGGCGLPLSHGASRATASDRGAGPRTRCGGWITCSKRGTPGWWMPT